MLRHLSLLAVATMALAATAGAARFHAHLARAEPGVEATVTALPPAVQLWFSESVNPRLTTATLLDADSAVIMTVKFIATPDSLLVVGPIARLLDPGAYQVSWRSMSTDGHVIRGAYHFRFAP